MNIEIPSPLRPCPGCCHVESDTFDGFVFNGSVEAIDRRGCLAIFLCHPGGQPVRLVTLQGEARAEARRALLELAAGDAAARQNLLALLTHHGVPDAERTGRG